jgi:beta-glucosidase
MGMITSQVDELIAQMTPAEKAAQLTQYFYFRLPAGAEVDPALGFDSDAQPKMVEAALQEGGVGSLLFVTDPA